MGCSSSVSVAAVPPTWAKTVEPPAAAASVPLAPECNPTRWRPSTATSAPSSRASTACPGEASLATTPASSSCSRGGAGDNGVLVADKAGRVQEHYSLMQVLGSGAIGSVRKAVEHQTGRLCAVKCMHTGSVYECGQEREAEIMARCAHPNILRFYECFQDVQRTYLVLEMCEGGDLMDRLVDDDDTIFTERNAVIVLQQVLSGLAHMHERRICHRDLKPDNFLFERRGPIEGNTLRIADFGAACEVQPGERLKEAIGTMQYMAPEVIRKDYDLSCDLWSCGVVLYLMLRGALPFDGSSTKEIRRKILRWKPSLNGRRWAPVSQDAKDLLRAMLHLRAEARPSAATAAEAPVLWRLAPGDAAAAPTVDLVVPFDEKGAVAPEPRASPLPGGEAVPAATKDERPPRPASREAWIGEVAMPFGPELEDVGGSRASSKSIRRLSVGMFAHRSRWSSELSSKAAAQEEDDEEDEAGSVTMVVPAPLDADAWMPPAEPMTWAEVD